MEMISLASEPSQNIKQSSPTMCKDTDLRRMPANGTFELTARCNLACKMCYVRMGQKAITESGFRERTAAEWIDMAQQAYENNTLSLLLTGGEIMMRHDFCEIYEAIAKMGFLLTIYTNATMVTDRVMEVLQKHPPHKIGVTMYGASDRTYETLCGCSAGFTHFQEGIRKLSSLPSLLDLRATIVKDNLADLPEMEKFAAGLRIPQSVTISRSVTAPIRCGAGNPCAVRLSPEENVEMIHPWISRLRDYYASHENEREKMCRDAASSLPADSFPPDFPITEETDCRRANRSGSYLFKNCQAGITQYHIDWRGHMMACTMTPAGYTKPFEQGFSRAWSELPDQYPEFKVPEKCRTCRHASFCESCPASRMAETGSWYDPPEYACREAEYYHKQINSLFRA